LQSLINKGKWVKTQNRVKRKIIYILISTILIVICAYFYFNQIQKSVNPHQKCPEEYTEDNIGTSEYKEVLTKWTSKFFKENPKATMSDWSIAKTQLWIDNNCTIAIQRSKMSGTFSDLKPWEKVDYEIQNALDKVAY